MLTKFSINNDPEMMKWDNFVKSHPKGTPFHLSYWLKTIAQTYTYKSLLYAEQDSSGNINGILPCFLVKKPLSGGFRLISLPFTDCCAPLFLDEKQEINVIKGLIKENAKSVKNFEIRGQAPHEAGFISWHYFKSHKMSLEGDISLIRKRIDKRTIQYSIRKAEREGIEVREENNQYGIEQFHMLNNMTRKKHGVPPQPMSLFINLYNNMIVNGYGFILLAKWNKKIIGASLFLELNKIIHYKYNASDPDYLKKLSPNHLLTWTAIKKGNSESCRYLDFGRTSPDNKGLIRYKEMWGAETEDLPYYYFPEVKGVSSKAEKDLIYRLATIAWHCLPDAVANRVGPFIYKYMA